MQIIPAIDGLDDASQARVVLYQSGRFVHAPALGIGLQPLDATLTALINGTIDPSKAYRRGNILGTVSQSSGTPTGAIIERGSNANGEYVRFADGTQVCTHTLAGPAISTAVGSVFTSNDQSWTFPAAFAVGPKVTAGCTRTSAGTSAPWVAGSLSASSTTSGSVRLMAGQSGVTGNINLIAVGRWF